jgi:hypothetical protein
MTPEEKHANEMYERGNALRTVMELPAWNIILSILDEEASRAENKLLKSHSNTPNEILAFYHRARAQRDLVSVLERTVADLIQYADNPPEAVRKYQPY